jgi:glycosyltransferase involved in cell wall biosynthesis
MRIVVMLTDLTETVGGLQSFNRSLVRALDEISVRRGWETRVLALNDSGRCPPAVSAATRYEAFAGHRLRFVKASLAAGRRAEVVVCGHVHLAPVTLGLNGARRLLIVHGVDAWRRLPPLQRLGARRTDRILSVSQFTRDEMARHNGLAPERFTIFPNTIEPTGAAVPPALPAGRFILSVARLAATEQAKGIDRVIEALPAVPEANYVVVGDGADRARLEELAARLGVRPRVQFVGRVPAEQLAAYYHGCDVFVLPSRKEGFGIVFLEAMSAGKPCIGAAAGGVPEVIAAGVTGLLVPPEDVAGLSRALRELLRDEPRRAAMGQAGRDRFEREFAYPRFRERLEHTLVAMGGEKR